MAHMQNYIKWSVDGHNIPNNIIILQEKKLRLYPTIETSNDSCSGKICTSAFIHNLDKSKS